MIQNRRPVVGYEGLYEVDATGNVYSVGHTAHRKRCRLKTNENGGGYLKVTLYDFAGGRKKKYVHRLVAEAFIPNPEHKPNINHLDCDVGNNAVCNLEWCNQSENTLYAIKLGRFVDNISEWNRRRAKEKR